MEGCCPTKILLIDSLLGRQLQHGYLLKIIDQSTKSSLSPVRVLQICMGKVCQLHGSGNCTIISPKQTKQSFISQLNLSQPFKGKDCILSHTHAAPSLQCSLQQVTKAQKLDQRLVPEVILYKSSCGSKSGNKIPDYLSHQPTLVMLQTIFIFTVMKKKFLSKMQNYRYCKQIPQYIRFSWFLKWKVFFLHLACILIIIICSKIIF